MSTHNRGRITWIDLTVQDAPLIRDFYQQVVGWSSQAVDVEDYQDYNMIRSGNEPVAGICHKRGGNANLPAQWMIYIEVENLDDSLNACERLGGSVVVPPRGTPGNRFVIIQDPAGAVCALYEHHVD